MKALGLLQAVLPGDGVQHEPHLPRLPGVRLGDGPLHLLELLHEALLGVEAARGVHEEEVQAPRPSGLGGVKGEGGGVRPFRALDHRDPEALPPLRKLGSPAARKVSPAQKRTFLPRPW